MTTTTLRINGLPYKVQADQLAGPITTHGRCDATEPASWGGARCSLGVHDPDVMHMARDFRGRLVAMWAGYLADEREHVQAADLAEPVRA